MSAVPDLRHLAQALGGEISNGQVLAPAPGHSPKDRGLAVRPVAGAPDGFLVHTFNGGDPLEAKDHVRKALGRDAFTSSNGHAAGGSTIGAPKPFSDHPLTLAGFRHVATYPYESEDGRVLYEVLRYEHRTKPKTFLQRRPDGRGGWLNGSGDRRVPYRMNDRRKVAHTTIWITEGEKDADRLASLGFTANTVASGKWTAEIVATFAGYDCLILEDNDKAGREKAAKAAEALAPVAESVRIVRLPGLAAGEDVSDWLDAGNNPDDLVDIGKAASLAGAAPPPVGGRGVTAAELFGMSFPPVRWIVDGYIAEGVTVLAGKPKLGKSWLALDIALAVARGGYVLGDRKCSQGAVLYAALEDTRRRIKSRVEMSFGHFNRDPWPACLTFWTAGEMKPLDNGGLAELRAWIAAADGPALIILDTFAKVRSGPASGEGAYAADYREMGAIKALADETGVSILVITHVRKMEADDPFDTVSGTLGLTGAADATLVLKRDGQGVTLYGQGRDVENIETALEWQKDVCRWRALGDAGEVRRSDERTVILEELEQADEPLTPRDLAVATGLTRNAVDQLLFKMAKAGEVAKAGRGKYLHPDNPHKNDKKIRDEDGWEGDANA